MAEERGEDPVELLEEMVRQLEIEKSALGKETDRASRERLEAIEQQLADLGEELDRLTAHWHLEKERIAAKRKTPA